jgi:hypothetical protein
MSAIGSLIAIAFSYNLRLDTRNLKVAKDGFNKPYLHRSVPSFCRITNWISQHPAACHERPIRENKYGKGRIFLKKLWAGRKPDIDCIVGP